MGEMTDAAEHLTERIPMEEIEALARAKAEEIYPAAWGEAYDPEDTNSRVCMSQLVAECRERIKTENEND